MSDAIRDENRVPGIIGASSSNGTTAVVVYVDPTTHRLYVDAVITSAVVTGGKTNNAAVPGATNLGTLPAVATAAAPSYTETYQVALSTDLAGNLRTTTVLGAGSAIIGKVGIDQTTPGTTNLVALSAETTKVIGTVRNVGNIGAVFDGVITAATAPANGVMGLGVYNSTEPSPTTGQSVGIQVDAKGRQRQVIMDAAGNTRGANVDANNNMGVVLPAETTKVIGTVRNVGNVGAVYDGVITPATAPANGIMNLGVYNSTEPSPTTGQSVGLQLDAKGRLRQVIMDAAGNTRGANVDASNRLSVTLDNIAAALTLATVTTVTTVSTLTGGAVAHDAADSGNPVKVGARALATPSTATMVANADRADNVADLDGFQLVRNGHSLGDLISERVTDTGGTSTAFTNFGATASTRNYVTVITVFNSSATTGYLDIRDGTAGSVLYTVPLPAGGGAVISNAGAPLFRSTANTALAYDVSAALTTVYISVTGFKSKV